MGMGSKKLGVRGSYKEEEANLQTNTAKCHAKMRGIRRRSLGVRATAPPG